MTPSKAPHISSNCQIQDASLNEIVEAVHLNENQLLSSDIENSRIYC